MNNSSLPTPVYRTKTTSGRVRYECTFDPLSLIRNRDIVEVELVTLEGPGSAWTRSALAFDSIVGDLEVNAIIRHEMIRRMMEGLTFAEAVADLANGGA